MTSRPALQTLLWQALRWILGIGLLWWVLGQSSFAECLDVIITADPAWLIIGLLLTLFGIFFGILRWHRLLQVQGLSLNFPTVFRISMIGQFFNAFMLGGCGGDIARAIYVCREFGEGSRAEATVTVIADRLIGLCTLILFGCLVILFRLPYFLSEPAAKLPALLMVAFLVSALCLLLGFFRFPAIARSRMFQALETRLPFGDLLRRAHEALDKYRRDRRELAIAVGYSLLVTLSLTLACYALGRALWPGIALWDVLALFPIITVLLSVPVTPGGIGVREILFTKLFAPVGMAAATATGLSLLVFGVGVFWSIFGSIFYFTQPNQSAK